MGSGRRRATVSMFLHLPQVWWAYLGLRSNPSILSLLDGCDRLVVFDDVRRLPPDHANSRMRTRYLLLCWDGVLESRPIDEVKAAIGDQAALSIFAVGDYSGVPAKEHTVQPLYPAGPLRFTETEIRFNLRTRLLLIAARIRGLLRPLKNVLQKNSHAIQEIGLLCGKRRIVFCGSYGMSREIVAMLCNRHALDCSFFEQFDLYRDSANASFENYKEYLGKYGLFLATLYDSSRIDSLFFLASVRLLGRQYYIERIRHAKLPLYVNPFSSGSYVDVYSTPFYSQHIFLDFGSVVGTGNYPRLADLTYFKKQFVEFDLHHDVGTLLDLARRQSLDLLFDQEWQIKSPMLRIT